MLVMLSIRAGPLAKEMQKVPVTLLMIFFHKQKGESSTIIYLKGRFAKVFGYEQDNI